MRSVFLNGAFVYQDAAMMSAFDAGTQHGVGVFETLTGGLAGDRPWALHLNEHMERLSFSARELGLSDSVHGDGLGEAVLETIRRSAHPLSRIRITVTGGDLNLLSRPAVAAGPAGAVRPTVLIQSQPATIYPPAMFERGIGVTIADTKANPLNRFEGHKTLNYWWRLQELSRAARQGAGEALVLQVTNHIAGGCVSNLLIVKGSELLTPIARGEEDGARADAGPGEASVAEGGTPRVGGAHLPSPVLPGVVRAWAIEQAPRLGLRVVRRMLSISDLLDADEAMLTNSSWGVLPVVKVEREALADAVVGPKSLRLIEFWRGLIDATAGA
ncbi:MAG: aminotransferase class IV [Phycisphaeraceae bacterium]|nr:aminotransferase class IV [Phycisphaeraceae bacterium]